eukprot:s322_g13.t2
MEDGAEIEDEYVFSEAAAPVKVNLVILEYYPFDAEEGAKILQASERNDCVALEKLLQCPHSPNVINSQSGCTPLHCAAMNGHVQAICLLLEAWAEIDPMETDGKTPLHFAAENGHLECVKRLLCAGADFEKRAVDDGSTPLLLAAENGHLSVVQHLVRVQPTLDQPTLDGLTPVNLAASNGHLEVVRCLVEGGANKDQKSEDGAAPLHSAAIEGHLDIARLLIEAGANKDDPSLEGGYTPLHCAAEHGHLDIVRLLVEAGASMMMLSNDGLTPVHVAAEEGQLEILRFLLESGVDCNRTTLASALDLATRNNHVWWHMMRGGNVVQMDADDDAMWGLDGHGSILWRPAGDVGKHSRWLRLDGPAGVELKLIAADNDRAGSWIWCIDKADRLWRRAPGDYQTSAGLWTERDDNGLPFWPKPGGSLLKDLKADLGWALAIDDRGNLLRRRINGTCCHDPVSPVHCWCAEVAPRFSAVSDNGEHGLGFYFPWLQHKHGDTWTASANRWLKQLTTRDDGHNAASPNEISQYFSSHCMIDMDHCAALDTTIQDFLKSWRKETHEDWKVWDWDVMKRAYSTCTQSTQICQRPMKYYGAFREKFMRHTFCCARYLQTPADPKCTTQVCKAYDITCPGSKLLTSDMDCTVYHSRDPGTLIKNMTRLATAKLEEYTGRPADLGVVFDLSLFGTWTWIPDEIFRRFDWPSSTKDLFEFVEGRNGAAVWVFRRKCRPTSRQAIYDKVKRIIRDGSDVHAADLENFTINLKSFVGNLANGAYGSGNSLRKSSGKGKGKKENCKTKNAAWKVKEAPPENQAANTNTRQINKKGRAGARNTGSTYYY